jgi:hypothetical protein
MGFMTLIPVSKNYAIDERCFIWKNGCRIDDASSEEYYGRKLAIKAKIIEKGRFHLSKHGEALLKLIQ